MSETTAPVETGGTILTNPPPVVADPTPPSAQDILFPSGPRSPEVKAEEKAPVVTDPPKPEEKAAEPVKATEPAKTDEKPVVPEKYEFKAPEGVTLDPAQVEAFEPIAKELGLTNEQAQKLVDLQMSTVKARDAAVNQAHVDQWAAQTKEWADAARSDKDYGGPKFAQNMALAAKAIDRFGSPGLTKALEDSGMGNHPDVVRFFWSVGKASAEDSIPSGHGGGAIQTRTRAEILFPNMKK